MKITFRILLLAALAGLGFWLWTIIFPSQEKQVLKRISSLAATATFGAEDGNFVRAGKVSSLISYFSTDAEIVLDMSGIGRGSLNGRDEIREAAARSFMGLKSLDVKFLDATVKIGTDRQSAEVNCTAEVQTGNNKELGVQEFIFRLKKIDGNWLITRVEPVKTLS